MKRWKRKLLFSLNAILFLLICKQGIKADEISNITARITNETEDRGADAAGAVLAYLDDELKVEFSFDISTYENGIYFTAIPKGLQYAENTLVCQAVLGEEQVVPEENTDYSLQYFRQIQLIMNSEGQPLFFRPDTAQEEEFYTLDGSLLLNGTLENAVTKYNEKSRTEYTLSEISESEYSNVMFIDFENNDYSNIDISYKVTKDGTATSTGLMECFGGVVYRNQGESVETMVSVQTGVSVYSYGLRLTLCDGESVDNIDDSENVLLNAGRLSDGVFSIYSYVSTFSVEDAEGLQAAIAGLGENEYYTIPTEDASGNKLYRRVTDCVTDTNGEVIIGGLKPQEYLVIESVYPIGYEISPVFLCIEENDWSDDTYMEGGYVFHGLWLNFPGLYLPNTGNNMRDIMQLLGIIIVAASFGAVIVMNKKGIKNIIRK